MAQAEYYGYCLFMLIQFGTPLEVNGIVIRSESVHVDTGEQYIFEINTGMRSLSVPVGPELVWVTVPVSNIACLIPEPHDNLGRREYARLREIEDELVAKAKVEAAAAYEASLHERKSDRLC